MRDEDTTAAWYIDRHGQRYGPISRLDLALLARMGHLEASDSIWCSALAEWVPVGSVRGLLPVQPRPMSYTQTIAARRS